MCPTIRSRRNVKFPAPASSQTHEIGSAALLGGLDPEVDLGTDYFAGPAVNAILQRHSVTLEFIDDIYPVYLGRAVGYT